MTEYDYSPEAYERHLSKMQTISRWVDRQPHKALQYANPFVPTVSRSSSGSSTPSPSMSRQSQSPDPHYRYYGQDSHSRTSRSQSRSPPASSYTSGDTGVYSHASHIYLHPKPHSSHRHGGRPPESRSYSYAHPESVSRSHTVTSGGRRGETMPMQYVAQPGQPVVYKGRDQTYVIIPSSRASVEVRSPQGVSPIANPQPQFYGSPLKKKPLLQRLFKLGSGSVSASHSRDSSPHRNYTHTPDPHSYTHYVPVRPSGGMRKRSRSLF